MGALFEIKCSGGKSTAFLRKRRFGRNHFEIQLLRAAFSNARPNIVIPMTIRSPKERLIQTLAYEAVGLAIATPAYHLVFGHHPAQSLLVLVLVSAVMLLWLPAYNTLFDRLEWRMVARVASDRPHGLRVAHAIGFEASAILLSTPVLVLAGGLGLWEALAADLMLTALYAIYGYVFHLAFDRLRPVSPGAGGLS